MSLFVDIRRHLAGFDLDVSFEVADARETLALLGPSGCGKSMTLKCVAGIVTPDEGRIVLNDRVLFDSAAGVNLRPQERRVGYLFQSYALFPNMTVEQNVGVGVLGASKEERAARVAEQVRAFRLDGLQKKRPAQLSGGQQQRVAIVRALLARPEVVFADEPTGNLDSNSGAEVLRLLRAAATDHAQTILMVTHDANAASYADRVVFIKDGMVAGEMIEPTYDAVLGAMAQLEGR